MLKKTILKQKMEDKTTLDELSGYNYKKSYFDKNKNKDLSEWLKFQSLFKCGKQGLAGLLVSKDDPNIKFCFKISKSIDHLIRHEHNTMKSLNKLSNYCPHFCKTYGIIDCKVNQKFVKGEIENPFCITTKYPVFAEVLINEYIENSCKFYNYLISSKISDDVVYSSVKQIMTAIIIAQQQCKFTHYDLHSYNIMMKKCDPDIVFLYLLKSSTIAIPTYGHYPKIIDFGFSYVDDMKDEYLYQSMAQTDIGFTSDRYDWVSDPKLFLVTISSEIKSKRRNDASITFRNIIKNIFGKLSIDWDSGWDNVDKKSISEYVSSIMFRNAGKSKFIEKNSLVCVDLLQTLIISPLEEQKTDSFITSFNAFADEFYKIEEEIKDNTTLTYILKRIVDVVRAIRVKYLSNREDTVVYFTQSVYSILDSVTKYCKPKNIKFEKLLCSILSLSRNIEGILYKNASRKIARKVSEYDDLPVKSTTEIYNIIDKNIKTNYVYNKNTSIFIYDTLNQTCETLALTPQQIKKINNMKNTSHAEYLSDCYLQFKNRVK